LIFICDIFLCKLATISLQSYKYFAKYNHFFIKKLLKSVFFLLFVPKKLFFEE